MWVGSEFKSWSSEVSNWCPWLAMGLCQLSEPENTLPSLSTLSSVPTHRAWVFPLRTQTQPAGPIRTLPHRHWSRSLDIPQSSWHLKIGHPRKWQWLWPSLWLLWKSGFPDCHLWLEWYITTTSGSLGCHLSWVGNVGCKRDDAKELRGRKSCLRSPNQNLLHGIVFWMFPVLLIPSLSYFCRSVPAIDLC